MASPCDQLTTDRQRAICSGTPGIPEVTRAKYVALWIEQGKLPADSFELLGIPRDSLTTTVTNDGSGGSQKSDNGRGELRGLGDVIAKATTAIGIRPCGGCKKRQETLNRLVPFKGAEE